LVSDGFLRIVTFLASFLRLWARNPLISEICFGIVLDSVSPGKDYDTVSLFWFEIVVEVFQDM